MIWVIFLIQAFFLFVVKDKGVKVHYLYFSYSVDSLMIRSPVSLNNTISEVQVPSSNLDDVHTVPPLSAIENETCSKADLKCMFFVHDFVIISVSGVEEAPL